MLSPTFTTPDWLTSSQCSSLTIMRSLNSGWCLRPAPFASQSGAIRGCRWSVSGPLMPFWPVCTDVRSAAGDKRSFEWVTKLFLRSDIFCLRNKVNDMVLIKPVWGFLGWWGGHRWPRWGVERRRRVWAASQVWWPRLERSSLSPASAETSSPQKTGK